MKPHWHLRGRLLFHNLKNSALSMTAGGGGKEIPDRLDGVAMLADHLADVAFAQLKIENDFTRRIHPGQHHLIGIIDELSNDVFEEFLHGKIIRRNDGGTSGRFSGRFLRLLDQAANRIRRLRSPANPIFDPVQCEVRILTGLLRVVIADNFDELAVTRAALVCHDNLIIRIVQRTFSAESD